MAFSSFTAVAIFHSVTLWHSDEAAQCAQIWLDCHRKRFFFPPVLQCESGSHTGAGFFTWLLSQAAMKIQILYNWLCLQKKKYWACVYQRRACACVCGRACRRSAVCSVKRCRRRGRSAECSAFVLGTNSHFISCDTRLPDHHTSVATRSALSAVAQTCQVHLYSSVPCIISQWVSHTRWWHQSCILLWLWWCHLIVIDSKMYSIAICIDQYQLKKNQCQYWSKMNDTANKTAK